MAAGAWTVYNESKKKIGNGSISLASTVYRMTLHTSASNANTATLSIYNELDNQVTEANGYSSSGKAMTGEVWTVGTSAGQYKFDMDDPFWSANGGSIANVKFAVLWLSAAASANRHLLCRSQLSTAQFSISTGNRLTIQQASTGVLTLA
jgi:hypothetical protein